jgi:hypothetical protein
MAFTNNEYFTGLTQVQQMLNIQTARWSEADLDACLPVMHGIVHDFLIAMECISAGPVTSSTNGYNTVRAVLLDIILRWHVRRESLHENGHYDRPMAVMTAEYELTDANKLALGTAFQPQKEPGADLIPFYAPRGATTW